MKYSLSKVNIRKIESNKTTDVYDLSVKDNHSYCVSQNNIAVHNCTTYGKTGFGGSMFSCVVECSKIAGTPARIPIIADGGIKCHGDIAKALVAGATMVMAGSLFAACLDSPAESIQDVQGAQWIIAKKRYFGSASTANKDDWRHIEGQIIDIPCNQMTYEQKLKELEADLQSAMSYGGCEVLQDFKKVDWDVVY